jgi:hypothetical protein
LRDHKNALAINFVATEGLAMPNATPRANALDQMYMLQSASLPMVLAGFSANGAQGFMLTKSHYTIVL